MINTKILDALRPAKAARFLWSSYKREDQPGMESGWHYFIKITVLALGIQHHQFAYFHFQLTFSLLQPSHCQLLSHCTHNSNLLQYILITTHMTLYHFVY